MNSETRRCQNCKQDFTIAPDDFIFYEKVKVSPPTWCPECRYQRRITNRNEWNFYKRDCTLCEKSIVSIYNPSFSGPVYCQPCYWSDKWDPFIYGQKVDFSRPFFDQFADLRKKVPRVALMNRYSTNSDYTNQSEHNKDCYMLVACNGSENCMYGNWMQKNKDCVDCYMIEKCELLYEGINCGSCAHSAFLEDCYDCAWSFFLYDCHGCTSCFGCYGLRNKSYCYLNEQMTKEDYERRVREFPWTRENIDKFSADVQNRSRSLPRKYYHGRNNVSSSGDYLVHNKNTRFVFNARHSENVRYCQDAWEARESRDLTEVLDNEFDYELEGCAFTSRNICISKIASLHDSYYAELSTECSDVFGCISLTNKKYCILNLQYDKNEYEKLKLALITHMKQSGEWGNFFSVEISPFPYNDSLAQDYFPLTKEEVLSHGWKWYDPDRREYTVTLQHEYLPSMITETKDDILKEVISCASQDTETDRGKYLRCATAFRLHPAELQFYRRLNIPVPHKCFPCRLQDRLSRRNPRKLWRAECQCAGAGSKSGTYKNNITHFHGNERCPNAFETSYAPERPEVVYCEQCYNAEVV